MATTGINPHTWLTETLGKLASGHPANVVGKLTLWIAVAWAQFAILPAYRTTFLPAPTLSSTASRKAA